MNKNCYWVLFFIVLLPVYSVCSHATEKESMKTTIEGGSQGGGFSNCYSRVR